MPKKRMRIRSLLNALTRTALRPPALAAFLGALCLAGFSEERHQTFDADPRWDGFNHRPASRPVVVRQNFGYRATRNASRTPGEIGGFISPAGEPAWYAKKISALTFNGRFSASGTMVVKSGGGNTLVGFSNSQTAKEWRTANSLVWRLNGRGDVFHAHFEYATQKWRAGAGVIGRYDREADRMYPKELPSGNAVYAWTLRYDPDGNGGSGTITATLGGDSAVCDLSPGHKEDGARFDRFGLLNVMKSADGGGELWVGQLVINGERQDLAQDPHWEERGNRRTYETDDVRPWFNFGWSASPFAGGAAAGEIGGRFFRGDCRYAERLAYYGDRLATLTLEKPLKASGRVSLRRGVSDSTTLLGFFHHERSVRVNPAQNNAVPEHFIGLAIEGPSSEGFCIYPHGRATGNASIGYGHAAPRILPDGTTHGWAFEYDPGGAGGRGVVTVSLDGQAVRLELQNGEKTAARFDRFGFVTPWIDGNEQIVYFDDLRYTASQGAR